MLECNEMQKESFYTLDGLIFGWKDLHPHTFQYRYLCSQIDGLISRGDYNRGTLKWDFKVQCIWSGSNINFMHSVHCTVYSEILHSRLAQKNQYH